MSSASTLDDGFDIDEAGPGDLWALIVGTPCAETSTRASTSARKTKAGSSSRSGAPPPRTTPTTASRSSRARPAASRRCSTSVTSKDNGGNGAVFKQHDAGDLTVVVDQTKTANNDDSDKTGLKVVQDGDGRGHAHGPGVRHRRRHRRQGRGRECRGGQARIRALTAVRSEGGLREHVHDDHARGNEADADECRHVERLLGPDPGHAGDQHDR